MSFSSSKLNSDKNKIWQKNIYYSRFQKQAQKTLNSTSCIRILFFQKKSPDLFLIHLQNLPSNYDFSTFN